jgi:hypothetical protein
MPEMLEQIVMLLRSAYSERFGELDNNPHNLVRLLNQAFGRRFKIVIEGETITITPNKIVFGEDK